jgi:hypothetical protein
MFSPTFIFVRHTKLLIRTHETAGGLRATKRKYGKVCIIGCRQLNNGSYSQKDQKQSSADQKKKVVGWEILYFFWRPRCAVS